MRILLDLMLISVLIALVGSVSLTLIVRRAVRRFRRAARGRIAATRGKRPPSTVSLAGGLPAEAWGASTFRSAGDLLTARTFGPALVARTYLPGPARPVAQVRLDLHRDIVATSRCLRAARTAGRPDDALHSSAAALLAQARQLQLDLRTVAAEPDRDVRTRMLATHAARAALIRRAAAQVRTALLEERSGADEATLRRIVDDVEDGATAATLRARAYRELSRR